MKVWGDTIPRQVSFARFLLILLLLLQKPQSILTVLASVNFAASPLTVPVLCSSCTKASEGPLCRLWNLQQLASVSWPVLR